MQLGQVSKTGSCRLRLYYHEGKHAYLALSGIQRSALEPDPGVATQTRGYGTGNMRYFSGS